jgi:plastocyanin
MNLTAGAVALALSVGLVFPAAAHAQDAPADPNAVPMQGNQFVPAEKTVTVGTTVTWMNMDAEEHDVITNDLTVISPLIKPGETWAFTFETPGTYAYVCDLHTNMQGVINVTAATAAEVEPAPAA